MGVCVCGVDGCSKSTCGAPPLHALFTLCKAVVQRMPLLPLLYLMQALQKVRVVPPSFSLYMTSRVSTSMQGRRTTYVPSSSSSFYLMQAPLQNAPPLSHCTCPLVNAYINICIYCKLCTSIWTKHMDKTKTKEEKRINIKCICEKLTKSEKNKIK